VRPSFSFASRNSPHQQVLICETRATGSDPRAHLDEGVAEAEAEQLLASGVVQSTEQQGAALSGQAEAVGSTYID
jgi:hypothetical protein